MSILSAIRQRRPYWPISAWAGLFICSMAVLFAGVLCYCPGFYLFWAAACCVVAFVSRRWCSGFALVLSAVALVYMVRDYRGLQRERVEQQVMKRKLETLQRELLKQREAESPTTEPLKHPAI